METHIAPIVWNDSHGHQWLVQIEVEDDRCISLKVSHGPDPRIGATEEITATLVRELPVGALLEQARSWIERREAFAAALFGGMVLDVMQRTNVIEVERSEDGEVLSARLGSGPVRPGAIGHARHRKVPREKWSRPGPPHISRDFLTELAQVYRVAQSLGLRRLKTVERYVSARVVEPVNEKALTRYLRECRRLGLLPASRHTSAGVTAE